MSHPKEVESSQDMEGKVRLPPSCLAALLPLQKKNYLLASLLSLALEPSIQLHWCAFTVSKTFLVLRSGSDVGSVSGLHSGGTGVQNLLQPLRHPQQETQTAGLSAPSLCQVSEEDGRCR